MSATIKRAAAIVACSLAIAAAFILARTMIVVPSLDTVPAAPLPVVNAAGAAERLAQAVQIRTISWGPDAPVEGQAFQSMISFIERSFPRVQQALDRQVVNNYSLLYRWQGSDPALKPIMLIAHMDVVPAEMGTSLAWSHGPYSGDIADGFVWGRGTLDDKSAAMGYLEAIELLLDQNLKPKRTVYLALGHDEELGGGQGAARIAAVLASQGVKLEFSLDEGMTVLTGIVPGLAGPAAIIGVTEKGYLSLQLEAKGQGGHVSMPPLETSIGRLAKAIARLQAHQMPASMRPPVSTMFDRLAPRMSFWYRLLFANRWLFEPVLLAQLESSPETNAVVRTTAAPTLFAGGIKENVLPGDARATINFRLLPGDTIAGVIAHVRSVIDDTAIAVSAIGISGEAPPIADMAGDGFALLSQTARQVYPDAAIAPGLVLAGTDSVNYAMLGGSNYRFLPVLLTSDDLSSVHGVNERISIANYERMIAFYAALIRKAAIE